MNALSSDVGLHPLYARPLWWLALLGAGLSTAVAMQARPKTLWAVGLGALLAGAAWSAGTALANDSVGCLLVGTALGLAGHAGEQLLDGSAWALLYPNLQTMVQGSSGLRGLLLLAGRDAGAGLALGLARCAWFAWLSGCSWARQSGSTALPSRRRCRPIARRARRAQRHPGPADPAAPAGVQVPGCRCQTP